jgi:hypothetical protein
VLLAVATLCAAGCGGSDSKDESAKRDYIAKADTVCRDAQRRAAPLIRRIIITVTGAPTRASLRRALPTVTALQAVGRDSRRRLQALSPPDGDRRVVDTFLTPAGRLVDLLQDARPVFERGTAVAALGLVQRAQTLDAAAATAAADYGFEVCGSVLQTPPQGA